MKNFLIVTLALVLALSLCACGKPYEFSQPAPSEAQGTRPPASSETPSASFSPAKNDSIAEFYDSAQGVWMLVPEKDAAAISFVSFYDGDKMNSGTYPGELGRECTVAKAEKRGDGLFDLVLSYPAVPASEMYDEQPACEASVTVEFDGNYLVISQNQDGGSEQEYLFATPTWNEAAKYFNYILSDGNESEEAPSQESTSAPYIPEDWAAALDGYWIYMGEDMDVENPRIYYFTQTGEVYLSPEDYYEVCWDEDAGYILHNEWAIIDGQVMYKNNDVGPGFDPIEYTLTLTDDLHMTLYDSDDGETLEFASIFSPDTKDYIRQYIYLLPHSGVFQ